MEIRIRESGQVMLEGEFRSLHPNTSFPIPLTLEIINEFGGDVVLEGPTPTTTRYQSVARDGVEQIGSDWFTKYKVVDFSDEAKASADEQQAKSVREDRNKRLADSDWTQLADSQVDKSAWATYRQALRDVPKQSGFPWEVTWADAP